MLVFRRVFSAKLPLVVACFIWVMAGEMFFRLPPVKEFLAPYVNEAQWATNVPDKEQVLKAYPNADLWYIGSSAVHHDLDPVRIDAVWGNGHQSINLGLVGVMQIRFMRQYLDEVFLPRSQPKVVAVGVMPYWFAFSLPEPYKTVQENIGIHIHEWDYELGFLLYLRSSMYRFVKPVATYFIDKPTDANLTQASGYEPRMHQLDETHYTAPIAAQVTENDRLEGSLQELIALRDELAARGIKLVVIAMPIHHAIIDSYPGGAGNFDAYRERLNAFTAQNGIAFLDLHTAMERRFGAPLPDPYFGEYTHLNDEGAALAAPIVGQFFSAQLG